MAMADLVGLRPLLTAWKATRQACRLRQGFFRLKNKGGKGVIKGMVLMGEKPSHASLLFVERCILARAWEWAQSVGGSWMACVAC